MSKLLLLALVCSAAAVLLSPRMAAADEPKSKEENKDGQIAHMVYFQLKDNSPDARKKLVEACKKYLKDHEGTVYFSAGVIADDFKRDVNDRDWDVGLHLVFKNRAAHDKYQDHKRHLQFIDENKANWKKVRVFDSVVD